jgi:hypothetical protein
MLNTCVGHAKQILGINDPLILTPYQLFKRLKHEEAKGTEEDSAGSSSRAPSNDNVGQRD